MEQIRRIQGDSIHLVSVNGDSPRQLRQIGNGGGGGTKDYNALENKPSIGGVTVEGSKTLTDYGLPTIPTKTSQLTNDSGFVNATGAAAAAPVKSVNGATGVVTVAVPTKTSQLSNDSGYITSSAVPTSVSQLSNDSGYVNASQAANAAPVQSVNGSTGAVTVSVPTKVSQLQNDSAFVNASGAAAAAPVQSVNGQTGTVSLAIPTVPTDVSAFNNDSGYVDATGAANAAPVQSVNGQTGDVALSIPTTASDVGALPDSTTYAASGSVGGAATVANGIPFAMVDATSTSTAYTATIDGITSYYDGLTIMLYNGRVTSAANFTISINGLGAYGSYSNMALGNPVTPTTPTRDSTIWNLNYAMLFTFYTNIGGTGTSGWVMYRGYDSNQNTLGYQIRTNSMSMPMTSKCYRYRLLFESADRAHYVPANNSTSTNATSARTPVTEAINPFGDIRYYGATTVLAAGDRPSVANQWQQNVVTIGYSFQKSPNYSLTGWKPVYLVCTPQTDGSAIIDSTDPITQTLPSTEDGKIYIHLGVAYSTTAIELTLHHPIYYYKSGAIRPWTFSA